VCSITPGKPINIHDVLVMALDESVLEDPDSDRASPPSKKLYSPHDQKAPELRDVGLQPGKKSLQGKGADRQNPRTPERADDLFGRRTLADPLGPYEELLTLEDVIDQELILYVSLNFSRNSRAGDGPRADAAAQTCSCLAGKTL